MSLNKKPNRSGFTLIELLVVIGIIAVLAGVVIIALNPARQFAQARDTQRWSNVNAILNGVGQNLADNKGVFKCNGVSTAVPTSTTAMKSTGGFDVAPCLIPTYISTLPFDPSATGAHYTSNADYNTGYTIIKDATTGRITIDAPTAEITIPITVTR